jgi:hypothetical protein
VSGVKRRSYQEDRFKAQATTPMLYRVAEGCPIMQERQTFHACHCGVLVEDVTTKKMMVAIVAWCEHTDKRDENHGADPDGTEWIRCYHGMKKPDPEVHFGTPTVAHAPSAADDHDGSTPD